MNTLNSLHNTIVMRPSDSELFKRLLSEDVMPDRRVIGAEFEQLRRQDSVLFKLGKGEHSTIALLGSDDRGLLKTAFKVYFPERSLAMQKPVAVHAAGYVAGPSGKTNGVGGRLVISGDFPCVMQDKDTLLRKTRLHGVEYLFHAGTVVLVLLMQFAQDVKDDEIGVLSLNQTFNEVLSPLGCHQKGQHHIVLVDQSKVRGIEVIPHVFQFAKALSPGGFFGIQLEIKDLLGRGAVVAHHGLAFRDSGGNVKRKKAFAYLWRAQEQHIAGLGYQSSD